MVSKKTIERLIIYKKLLEIEETKKATNIFSHQIAELSSLNSSLVRRDLMVLGYSGNQKNGYKVKELIKYINEYLDPNQKINIILVGAGNLGRALLHYFASMRAKYTIVACFDIDKSKIGNFYYYTKCYSLTDMEEIIKKNDVSSAILTVPSESAQELTDKLIGLGIKGLINFATVRVKVPDDIYIEHMDFSITVEKIAFFAKSKK